MIAFIDWWHRMMWAHPMPFVLLYAIGLPLWCGHGIGKLVHFGQWIESRPIRRWIYTRRERRWLARQPKRDGAPYRE